MLSLYLTIVILVIYRFGFEGWIWILIASVPDLCIFFYFYQKYVHFGEKTLKHCNWTNVVHVHVNILSYIRSVCINVASEIKSGST